MSSVIHVLISDGRKLVREGLSALLEKHADIRVVAEADDNETAIRLVAPLGVEVVVLVLSPGAGAASGALSEAQLAARMVRELSEAHPQVKTIVLTLGLTPPDVRQLVNAGAAACLTKESASQELVAAIRSVVQGKVYLSPRLTEQVVHRYVQASAGSSRARATQLAPRETEVLRRIAAGQSTKEIAYALHVGPKTIETHRRRIMEKLNRYSVAELTQYALLKGVIALPDHVEA